MRPSVFVRAYNDAHSVMPIFGDFLASLLWNLPLLQNEEALLLLQALLLKSELNVYDHRFGQYKE